MSTYAEYTIDNRDPLTTDIIIHNPSDLEDSTTISVNPVELFLNMVENLPEEIDTKDIKIQVAKFMETVNQWEP